MKEEPLLSLPRDRAKKLWHEFSRLPAMVLYMSSSFCLLGVESRDFSQAEKERTACKAEQIHKKTTIFTKNGPRLSF